MSVKLSTGATCGENTYTMPAPECMPPDQITTTTTVTVTDHPETGGNLDPFSSITVTAAIIVAGIVAIVAGHVLAPFGGRR